MKFLETWDQRLTRLSEERFYFAILSLMACAAAALVMGLALTLHYNFLTIACDTAAVQSAIVNTVHGDWFRDTAYDGPNLLGLHTGFVLLLIAPVYAIFPSPETLYILQILGVYSTVIPIYLVGLEVLRRPLTAFLLALAALTSPILLHMAMAPVHPETWIAAAVFWSYLFYRQNRAIGFWASFAFAVSCGEQAALIYVALGLSWLLVDDGTAWRKRYGKYALAGGLGWLVFAFALVFPLMRAPGQNDLFAYNYDNWKVDSGLGLIGALALDPAKALGLMCDLTRWIYFFTFIGVPLLIAFGYSRTLILLVPFPIYFLMGESQLYLYFHAYYFQFGFLAGYLALILFLARWDVATRLGTTLLMITMLVNILFLCTMGEFYVRFDASADQPTSKDLHETFATIPADAAVFSPHRYSAYLSNRPNMVMGDLSEENVDFKAKLDAKYAVTNVHPEEIDYIVCDLQNDQCGARQIGLQSPISLRRRDNLNRMIKSGKWRMFWTKYDVVILRRVGK